LASNFPIVDGRPPFLSPSRILFAGKCSLRYPQRIRTDPL
jgi:hypothetical protein